MDAEKLRGRTPFVLFTGSLGITLLLLTVLVWYVADSHRTVQRMIQGEFRLKELVGTITHLDEVLTMSARMAAATGHVEWEQRYRRFEPKLDAAIQETKRLAPNAHIGEDAEETNAANLKLVEMENAAFQAVAAGNLEGARLILFSPGYEEQKVLYAAGMEKLARRLTEGADTALAKNRRRTYSATAMAVAMLPGLLLCWAVVWEILRRWKRVLTEQNRELSRQAAEMEELNRGLDRKIDDRTEELRKEIEQRKQAEIQLGTQLKELELMNKIMMGREEKILELKERVRQLSSGGAGGDPGRRAPA